MKIPIITDSYRYISRKILINSEKERQTQTERKMLNAKIKSTNAKIYFVSYTQHFSSETPFWTNTKDICIYIYFYFHAYMIIPLQIIYLEQSIYTNIYTSSYKSSFCLPFPFWMIETRQLFLPPTDRLSSPNWPFPVWGNKQATASDASRLGAIAGGFLRSLASLARSSLGCDVGRRSPYESGKNSLASDRKRRRNQRAIASRWRRWS